MEFTAANFNSLYFLLAFALVADFAQLHSTAQLLPLEEVKSLQQIAAKLNIKYWRVNQNSCSGKGHLNESLSSPNFCNITCNCTYEKNTVCHVRTIEMKRRNVTGVIPEELGNLPYLQVIDLTRNYITGSIPPNLSKAPLTRISFLGNRLSGQIPMQIGDITSLEELVLEDNQLSGPLPDSLGNLSNLRKLCLSSNNFTGIIPQSFEKLKNLKDFRIGGNSLSGKIPNFIGNWTELITLELQGTSMEGPLPHTISSLTNLSALRITDLIGTSMEFPDLRKLENITYLVLRNCLINGSIPKYIGDMKSLKHLDLSFNRLTGPIPDNIAGLDLNFLFLTNNFLTGVVPTSLINAKNKYDLSYNNFSGPQTSSCQQSDVNVISSYSPFAKSNEVSWCFKKGLPCSTKPKYHSLFINCGGEVANYEGNEYEGDDKIQGSSTFSSYSEKWAYSSTGVFTGNDRAPYLISNKAHFNSSDANIYGTARLAPVSLKYYGLCMLKGNYTVRLHFAEIMFSNDATFSSNGRRIFDILIQGKIVRKNFNIMEEAKGASRGLVLEFNDTIVNGTTLEIHLYWAGKGTAIIPFLGVYGPLISAISVESNFNVSSGLSAGSIVGIVVASCVAVALILVALQMKGYLWGKNLMNSELQGLEFQTGYYTLRQIKVATDNFNSVNKIGEGGFGPVYKGILPDGLVIAVKQLSSKSKQGNREFVNEIGMISALQHPNLVRLFGYCIEGNQLLLVYEYMVNNSLARALFGEGEFRLKLDWPTRFKICMGIARGLAYLHEESRLKIVHRDIKATNVLLDKDLNAKISDFGLAKLDDEEDTHISTRIAGTIGYMAPEYAMRGYLTDKADVYSFGVVTLEIVSGKSNTSYRPREEFVYLLDWAYVLQEQGNLLELVDPCLDMNYCTEEAMKMLHLSLLCTNPSPSLRPPMTSVVSMLDGRIAVQPPVVKRSTTMEEDMKFKAFAHDSSRTRVLATTTSGSDGGPWLDSSISLPSKDDAHKLLPSDSSG